MDTFWGRSATYWTGVYALLTAGLLVVAVVAVVYAWRQWRASREQIEDARKAAAEASRPYILVTAQPTGGGWRLFELSVRNIGHRPALEVRVRLDPSPRSSMEVAGYEIAKIKMLTEPIAMIAPGQEMGAFWDSYLDRHNVEGLPTMHGVTTSYTDTSGHRYDEHSVIDLEAMRGTTYIDPPKTVDDIATSLEEVFKVLKEASVLNRQGALDVGAVTESRREHSKRVDRDEYERAKANLAIIAGRTPSRPDLVAVLEAQVAAWEARHHEGPPPDPSESPAAGKGDQWKNSRRPWNLFRKRSRHS